MTVSIQKILLADRLPTLPQVALRVIELAQQCEPDLDALILAIKADPSICSRMLVTVNSAMFGLKQRVSSIEVAVPILGVNLVRTLVLGLSLSGCRAGAAQLRQARRLWRCSVTQAVCAELLAAKVASADPAVWFLAGLLLDIGRLALLCGESSSYAQLVDRCDDLEDLIRAEEQEFGCTHAIVSRELCRKWALDDLVTEAVAHHHDVVDHSEPTNGPVMADLMDAMRLSSRIADYLERLRRGMDADFQPICEELCQIWGHDPASAVAMLVDIDERVAEVATMFGIDVGEAVSIDGLSIDGLVQQAESALLELAVQGQIEAAVAARRAEAAEQELGRAKEESQELMKQVSFDPLTGALTRRGLLEALADRIDECQRRGRCLGVVFMDLDRFKSINDTFGHKLGDELLTRFVRVIQSSIREEDEVFRYGGDEFVVTFSTTNEAILARMAERIRRYVEKLRLNSHPDLAFTSSMGLVIVTPADFHAVAAARVLEEADNAMYIAKKAGGNQVAMFRLSGGAMLPYDAANILASVVAGDEPESN